MVEAVGKDVTLFKVGDRVCPVFPQGHHWVSHNLSQFFFYRYSRSRSEERTEGGRKGRND